MQRWCRWCCLFVPAEEQLLFDAERLFLDSSAVKKRTFIPVVGEILTIRCSKKLLHVSNLYSAARTYIAVVLLCTCACECNQWVAVTPPRLGLWRAGSDCAAAITLRPVRVPHQLLYGYYMYNDVQLISCTPGEVQDLLKHVE